MIKLKAIPAEDISNNFFLPKLSTQNWEKIADISMTDAIMMEAIAGWIEVPALSKIVWLKNRIASMPETFWKQIRPKQIVKAVKIIKIDMDYF